MKTVCLIEDFKRFYGIGGIRVLVTLFGDFAIEKTKQILTLASLHAGKLK